ncbi:hypothetical protein F442_07206 [Phytophthora nicotianae P10297]|uniref:Uncharacterized protein n=3 Tax=Phytophthora nicotianae TaxID=4792 RepID=W2ZGV3_PHYNI|nr:hypothetical protein L917_06852 [Phytophthora nicotianae]ETO77620.1 hypothetical protein F444_07200 [Phytophthora nicotianae P1976]ETP46543.1 hypothetical protein F442_07206 [Phytophthora nicotianae P10297]
MVNWEDRHRTQVNILKSMRKVLRQSDTLENTLV